MCKNIKIILLITQNRKAAKRVKLEKESWVKERLNRILLWKSNRELRERT